MIDKEESFCFKQNSYMPRKFPQPHLFGELNKEINLLPRETCHPKAQTLLEIVGPNVLPCKLESRENIEVFNPQRVLIAVRYDQRIFRNTRDLDQASWWPRPCLLIGAERLFCPGLGVGVSSPRVLFEQKCIEPLDALMGDKESSLEIAEPTLSTPRIIS